MIQLLQITARGLVTTLVLALCLGALSSRASAGEPPDLSFYFGPLQPHPTKILTTFEGKAYPIIGVRGEYAQIAVGDSVKTLRSASQTYQVMRAADYAPGSVEIGKQDVSATVTTHVLVASHNAVENWNSLPVGDASFDGSYSCRVVSPEDHPDCYVVVLFFRQADDGTPISESVRLGFGHLGDLKAGQSAVAVINRSYVAPAGTKFWFFPMVFSQGRELRSNYSGGSDDYFRHQESFDHQKLLEQYTAKFAGTDHSVVPYLQIPLRLPPGVDPHSLPANLKATFSVDQSGGVDSIQFGDGIPPSARQALDNEIRGWMFLPRLKHGEPVRTLVTLPLAFN